MIVISRSDQDTIQTGEDLSKKIKNNVIVFLHGHLGAGKTTFVKGVVNGLGGDADDVTSPTYVYMNDYQTSLFMLRHMDLYRLEKGSFDEELFGMIDEDDFPFIIEWPDRIGEDLKDFIKNERKVIDINIDIVDDYREITIKL
jgi:tRNA threonylcarbamoyladenosine biosynthesis protein TsaE